MLKTVKNRFSLIIFALLILCGLLVLDPSRTQKISGFDAYNTYMSSALEAESQAYITYRQFTGNIAGYDEKQIFAEYPLASKKWKSEIEIAQKLYSKYTEPMSNSKMKKLSTTSLDTSKKVFEATALYDTVFVESDTPVEKLTADLTKADTLMNEAILSHDSVIDQFNKQTKRSYKLVYNLAISAIVAGVISLIFLSLSFTKSQEDKKRMRAKIFRSLFVSTSLMFIGLLISFGGLRQALTIGGGEYFMLFVPLLLGVGAFIYNIYLYWAKDTVALNEMKK